MVMFAGAFQNRRVLVTGHTGFKGAWLSIWLRRLGAEVHGLALPPETMDGVYATAAQGVFASESMTDIRDEAATAQAIAAVAPEFVFHLAAQPLVRRSYSEPLETVATNVMGTAHVLNALRTLPAAPQAIVVVTSDKSYENVGWTYGYRENDPLGGYDPYSASKGACEIITAAWQRSFFNEPGAARLATARGGNVIGGGDWAENRIVPDCIAALRRNQPIELRNPTATRPWQHVLDCLSGYLWLGARLAAAATGDPICSSFNFGPALRSAQTVQALVTEVLRHWPGQWRDLSEGKAPHEAQFLQLAIEKAAAVLGWFPIWGFAETVQHTVDWYRRQDEHPSDLDDFTLQQIRAYENAATAARVAWAINP